MPDDADTCDMLHIKNESRPGHWLEGYPAPGFHYYAHGALCTIRAHVAEELLSPSKHASRSILEAAKLTPKAIASLKGQHSIFAGRLRSISEAHLRLAHAPRSGAIIVPTESLTLDDARSSEVRWLGNKFGMEIVREGNEGKVLLQAPIGEAAGVRMAFAAARACFERGRVGAAHPNFIRVIRRPAPSASPAPVPWNLNNPGRQGIYGADVHALAAWTITRGDPSIRVAVLDEGVDTAHPRLKHAVIAEKDFIEKHRNARPDRDDAHGTACAGIIASKDNVISGLAPECSLIAVRMAKGDGADGWVLDDFETADGIDWAWRNAKADVLSNSWSGGPEVDVVTNAFDRARTKGRSGKGSVIVIAAGNEQAPIEFPGTLPYVLTVGASNQWDQRKTKRSKDGEDWWGSNYGEGLDLVAPGVKIATTDITGYHGFSRTDFTRTFNGTSAAAPHAAAAAALVLSMRPSLSEDRVRDILTETADPLSSDGEPNAYVGHGRLNSYEAIRMAMR